MDMLQNMGGGDIAHVKGRILAHQHHVDIVDQVDTAMLTLGTVTDTPSTSQNDYSPTGWDGTHPSKATVMRLSPTASIQITGVGGGTEGRLLTLVNATDAAAAGARMIVLPNESASSTAANRFLFAQRFAYILMPGDSIQMVYDGTASRWRQVNRGVQWAFFEDTHEMGGAIGTIFAGVASGTGASNQQGAYLAGSATQKPLGVWESDTGTTATGRAGYSLGGTVTVAGVVPEQGAALFLSRVAVEVLANTATEDYDVATGFSDGVATNPYNATDGVYWYYNLDTSAS